MEPGGGAPGAAECRLFAGDNVAGDTLTIGCNEPLQPRHAPVAANESERLLFRQIYETLVRVDCRGRLRPGLARSWEGHDGGRVWEFRLRKNARFSDGSHLTAADVRAAWAGVLAVKSGPRRPPWSWVRPDSVRTAGDDRLWVALSLPLGEEPLLFAHPELAVTRPGSEGEPPLGSGSYAWAPEHAPGRLCAVPNRFHPEPGLSVLCVLGRPGTDPRDLLSGGVDLVVVDDRDVLEYAENLPGVTVAPLPWSRLYLLLSSRFRCPADPPPDMERMLSLLRDELAGKVVGIDSRPVRSFAFDPDREAPCFPSDHKLGSGKGGSAGDPRILYWEGDEDAGRIASRLVALEAGEQDGRDVTVPCLGAGGMPVAVPETWSGLLTSIAPAADWAYVISVRRAYPDPCLDLAGLRSWVPWAGDPANVLPLLVSRSHLVANSGVRGVALDWDGVPVLNEAGWDRTGTVP